MSSLISIVGARPQFIKAAPVSRALAAAGKKEVMVHTGQHYDDNMSGVFFAELGMAKPAYELAIGSGSHGGQTGAMLAAIEQVLRDEDPDEVLVYGDTNSTLAGALAAAKLHIPVLHVEAGLRSFDRRMPEEINRVLVDHVSEQLFVPSQSAMNNLAREGITSGVHVVGDVMRSALEMAAAQSKQRLALLDRCEVAPGSYLLATVHRQENTDATRRLAAIIDGLTRLQHPIVFPLHPRTRKLLAAGGIDIETAIDADGVIGKLGQIRFIEPVGYLDMVMLQGAARIVLTDSGGVQKEAYWLQRPCITLRDRTEWIETVESGWNRLVGADADAIVAAVGDVLGEAVPADHPPLYGDADAAERIAALI